ncbi:Phosphatidylcholine-sterol acyltransferase [Tetrabaena socialis]|uniref:Phosphatidylcholine-sterol acyltransferase n=1 Tax=Tetrabaena socialis TaxID=47790 RepID=A0A2J8AK81_9CHLO|nr:Phosphatidylcholine-sterol acyltransferase [Tetrabaena socialis]|eukprot:PNH12921.1 Phosphatidylcholine-sterol acyltransferase [Tetrabaena socialis]
MMISHTLPPPPGRSCFRPSVPHWWCPRSSASWYKLWPVLQSLLPWHFACYVDNLRLVPGGPSNPAASPAGVSVRLGATLEPAHGDPRGGDGGGFSPWAAVAARLRQLGWGEELLDAHAYDWRRSPPLWALPGGDYERLRAEVEAKVAASGRRVVLLGLSLGATYVTGFLSSRVVDAAWKERHVERFVSKIGRSAAFWEASLGAIEAAPPNVTTYCFYSYGLPSPVQVTFGQADFGDASPAVRYADGDVTAPHASLAACRVWAGRQVAPVHSISYYGVVHAQLTGLPEALQDIVDAVSGLGG